MPYIGFEPTASDTLSVFKYVATGSQTTFTGADAGGATLSYDVGDGSCQVWLNGVRLDSSDITATNSTSVVLAACTAGDIVHVQATKAFLPSDVVSASSGGTFASAVTVPAFTATGAVTLSGGASITGTTPTLTIGDAGEEDAKIVFDGHAQDFHIGLDDTADDLVIGLGSALGTTTHMAFDETGAIIKPLQPCVMVHPASSQDNVAASSNVTVVWGTERFDQNGDFAANTFTAPVTGKYIVNVELRFDNIDTAADYIHIYIVSSNKSYNSSINDYSVISADPERWTQSFSGIIDMDASDTLTISVYIGGGAAQTDITTDSYFSIGLFA